LTICKVKEQGSKVRFVEERSLTSFEMTAP
jgi:hypothetical protein